MHPQAYAFVKRAAEPLELEGARVLEIGSYNVNGSVRPLFADAAEYIGVDKRDGPGVDIVADGAQVDGLGAFDVVVCCEVLEHTPDPQAILDAAYHSLKPGGLLILTAAGPGRPPHGVMGGAVGDEFYANIEPDALDLLLWEWERVTITEDRRAHDVYATARKPEVAECESC
jgi:SAM-dependent methyltransferase